MSGEEGSSLTEGRDSKLLPTPSLDPDGFEDFTERLLSAHRFSPSPVRHVARVERWGRKGDKQDGIDFEGGWSDGKSAAWQCKRQDKLTVADVKKYVGECTFLADEYYLVFSGEASSQARAEIKRHKGWQLLDRRGLGRMLEDLPLQMRRRVLDQTWGATDRRRYLGVPGEDSFLTIADVIERRRDDRDLLNDVGPAIGRLQERETLDAALDRDGDWPPVIVVAGVGGVGKTRLVSAALGAFQESHPQTTVLWLSPGRAIDQDALSELPFEPAVIVVDDAHRDPHQLRSLLEYVRRRSDTQIVLGSRGAGVEPIRAALILGGYRDSQIQVVSVGPLSPGEARRLVESLASGLNLPFQIKEYVATQARDAPFLAVLTINLLRAGEMTGSLALDEGLREQVLAQYEETLVNGVEGFDGSIVRRMLAIFSALGSVDATDELLRDRLVALSGVDRTGYLRLLEKLIDRGLLVGSQERLRVIPEVFADQVLEAEAAVGAVDTGFTNDLWVALHDVAGEALLAGLASLDWRLTRRGGPSVIDVVWAGVAQQVGEAGYAQLHSLLKNSESLVYTQPDGLVGMLRRVSDRLDELDLLDPADRPTDDSVEETVRGIMGMPPLSREDVERLLPKLYGGSAVSSPALLEQALAALWTLGRRDGRSTNSNTDHARRILVDRLADVGDLPDASFPDRILNWVDEASAEPREPTDVASPLFAIQPLLAKQGMGTSMVDRRTISLRPYFVSPAWARPIRDRARDLLQRRALDDDLVLAAEAITLLGDALREPVGMMGAETTTEQVLAWEEDDLATLTVLQHIAGTTPKASLRRKIRREIEWTAERGLSPKVQHAALALLTDLDQIEGDDLADFLLSNDYHFGLESRRGVPTPSIAEFENSRREAASVEDEITEASISARIKQSTAADEATMARVSATLWPINRTPANLRLELEAALDEVLAVNATQHARVDDLFRYVVKERSELVKPLIDEMATAPGPLDEGLHVLLGGWRELDETSLVEFISGMPTLRVGVRRAIALAASRYGWTASSGPLREHVVAGTVDEDEETRQLFLASLSMKEDPVGVARILADAKASAATAEQVLRRASYPPNENWGRSLTVEQAQAVLDVIRIANEDDWDIQRLTSNIAIAHPKLVLDHLLHSHGARRRVPQHAQGLGHSFVGAPDVVATWILSQARGEYVDRARLVVAAVFKDGLPDEIATAISVKVTSLDANDLINTLDILGGLTWVPVQPLLARKVLARARELDPSTVDTVRVKIGAAMTANHWGFVDGVSSDLDQALERSEALLEVETDSDLREALQASVETLRGRIESTKRDDEDDD